MTKSNGIKSLKQAAKLLNKHALDGESLAYINKKEAGILKLLGGAGKTVNESGVPSYFWDDLWKGVKKVGSNILGRYTDKEHGGENVLKDLASLGGGYVGWQEAKELSEFQKKQYEKQLAEEALNEMWFAQQTDEGAPLKAPTNVPSTIEDVSVFSEATGIPTMKTAAQGGRIGYNMGGIDTPFQGIGALNPRMGYQDAGEVVEKTFSEGVPQQFPSDALGAINVNEEQMAVISDMNNNGMDTSLISTISGVEEDTVIRYIRTLNAQAHGGRIGYQKGTHPLDQVAMDTF